MLARLYELLRPTLLAIDPEISHRLAIRALALPLPVANVPPPDPRLARRLMGLDFPNSVGVAGGFDKNAEAVDGVFRLGFGFVEIGTVTPRPQAGNDKPRLFRLMEDAALVNRLGFNNQGFGAAHRRLVARTGSGIVGVNIGVNRDSTDRVADYIAGIAAFADVAAYFVINISSPNTVGLRDLQAREQLRDLLTQTLAARDQAPKRVPLLVKIAPDLSDGELAGVAEALVEAGVDGVIATNTTTSRPEIADQKWGGEIGGLSGRPLFRLSTIRLARLRKLVGTAMPIVGVGGVESGETAWAKFVAGADLVQLYTGMIYKGPGLPAAINRYLARRLEREGHASIADIVGKRTAEWAAEEI